jgi:hypothetical protein
VVVSNFRAVPALTAAQVFTTPVTNPAWKVTPSCALAGADKIISPDLERFYGARHSVYESLPKEVAALIEEAARHAKDPR